MAAAGSLVSAVREKYCSDPEDEPSNFINIGKINQTAIILAPSSGTKVTDRWSACRMQAYHLNRM